MFLEKKVEEDSPALSIAWIRQYKEMKIAL